MTKREAGGARGLRAVAAGASTTLATAALLLAAATPAGAHDGRRFSVEVVNGKLQAQGINGGTPDGAPPVRPYINVIHDHWRDVSVIDSAVANLPGFDVPSYVTPLIGQQLRLELVGASKWRSPPLSPEPNTTPRLNPLDPGETISITGPLGEFDTDNPGSLILSPLITVGGALDLDLVYQVNELPRDEIHVLEFVLSASPASGAPGSIQPSDPIQVLLSPDGATPQERLHEASLFLEANVTRAVFIPEPSALAGVEWALAVVLTRRPRRRSE